MCKKRSHTVQTTFKLFPQISNIDFYAFTDTINSTFYSETSPITLSILFPNVSKCQNVNGCQNKSLIRPIYGLHNNMAEASWERFDIFRIENVTFRHTYETETGSIFDTKCVDAITQLFIIVIGFSLMNFKCVTVASMGNSHHRIALSFKCSFIC